MCGRYVLFASKKTLQNTYGVVPDEDFTFSPNYNVAPTVNMPVVIEKEGRRVVGRYRWGLVPFWAKEVNTGYSMINARSETLSEKRTFSKPFQSQRCIVPANGFYEWLKEGSSKIPHYITSVNSPFMHFAGLYEHWKGKDGQMVDSFTIITTKANKPVSELHDRMPAMLLKEEFDKWLDPNIQDINALQDLLRPWPDDDIQFYKVSQDVNNVRNNGEQLIQPYRDLFS